MRHVLSSLKVWWISSDDEGVTWWQNGDDSDGNENNYVHLMRRVLSSMKVGRMSDVDKDDESGDGNDSAQEKNEDDGD